MEGLTKAQQRAVERFDAGEDIGEDAEPVSIEVRRPLDKIVPIRIPADRWEVLAREANDLGTRPTTLLRIWLLERLRDVARRDTTPTSNAVGSAVRAAGASVGTHDTSG